jgi:hypothetical protein
MTASALGRILRGLSRRNGSSLWSDGDYLNELPTSFSLSDEQVRLRAAAGAIMRASPEYQRMLRDLGAPTLPAAAESAAAH